MINAFSVGNLEEKCSPSISVKETEVERQTFEACLLLGFTLEFCLKTNIT